MIKDTLTGCKHGEVFINKTRPAQWLLLFLEQHAPDENTTDNMKIRVDKGGELRMSQEIRRVCGMMLIRLQCFYSIFTYSDAIFISDLPLGS